MFQHIEAFAGDPILTLNEQFAADPRADKINLSIGVYLNDEQRIPLMGAVAAAEARWPNLSSRTLPADGRLPAYREQSRRLVFGEGQGERIATIQTLGGSGALKVGADFPRPGSRKPACGSAIQPGTTTRASSAAPVLKSAPILTTRLKPTAWPSTPCWPAARLPAGDIVVLHACCHNPTGADLSQQQWRELALVVQERGLLPFFDIAYQASATASTKMRLRSAILRSRASLCWSLLPTPRISPSTASVAARCMSPARTRTKR
jgi:aromatic-amino-acid transaminase